MDKISVFFPAKRNTDDYQPETIENAKQCFENNFDVLYDEHDISLSKRIDLMKKVGTSDVLIAFYGGKVDNSGEHNSSIELVKELTDDDFDEIKKNEVKIVALSDVTYFLSSLLNHGIPCFYGPNFLSFSQCSEKDKLESEIKYLIQAIKSDKPYTLYFDKIGEDAGFLPWTFSKGTGSGRLIGGNLNTIYTLAKDYSESFMLKRQKGDIIFLEDNDPHYFSDKDGKIFFRNIPYSFSEELLFFKEIGFLNDISGLIIGKSSSPDFAPSLSYLKTTEKNFLEKILVHTGLSSIPIVVDIACGHKIPSITLPFGKEVILDGYSRTLTVL